MSFPKRLAPVLVVLSVSLFALSGCIGQAIETTTDAVIAVGKVPFKVGGAVVDVVTGDDDEKKKEDDDD
ncbi:MAG: NF038104 family lipoprotein [Gammaproteobacteria bacterium]